MHSLSSLVLLQASLLIYTAICEVFIREVFIREGFIREGFIREEIQCLGDMGQFGGH